MSNPIKTVNARLSASLLMILGALNAVTAQGTEYYYEGASNVWTGTCYVPVGGGESVSSDALTTDDVVVLKKNQVVYISDDTIGFFAKIKAVRYAADGIRAYIHLEHDKDLACWFGDTQCQYFTDTYLVKTGPGRLTFAKTGNEENYRKQQNRCYNYNTGIDLREGSIALEPPYETAIHCYRDVIVAEGTTLFGVTAGRTMVETLAGEGDVTNTTSSGTVLQIAAALETPTVFAGVLSGFGTLLSSGHTYFTGVSSTIGTIQLSGWDGVTPGRGITGFMSLAGNSSQSSLGTGTPTGRNSPFYLKYLGCGETIERNFSVETTATTPAVFDGGAHGGLVFTGDFSSYTRGSCQQRLLFTSAAGADICVLSNNFAKSTDGAAAASFYLTKAGIGTWRICERANQELAGVVGVREGVLEFDTIREAGWPCSLGTADLLYGDSCAEPSALERVPYAHVLGGTTSEGTLEYIGNVSRFVMTRPLALAGAGRIKSENAVIHWQGVSGIGTGERKITIECGDGQEVRLANVMDLNEGEIGNPVVSVVKEGAGDLILSGELSFSGDLIAKGGGTLTVRNVNGASYSWYKLTLKETVYSSPLDVYSGYVVKTGSGSAAVVTHQLTLNEFGLYDQEGNRLNAYGASAWSSTPADLEPGQIALDNADLLQVYNIEKTHVGQLQSGNNGTMNVRWIDHGKWPKANDPQTWISAIVRMGENVAAATQFDLCYNEPGTDMGRNPTAFSIFGSADGFNWEEVASTNDVVFTPSAALCWLSDGTVANTKKIEQNAHQKLPLAHSTVQKTYSVMNKARSVSVEPGTTLKLDVDMPIRGLTCGATGLGTIIGGRMEAAGAIRLIGDGLDGQELFLPADFQDVSELESIGKWKVFVNGIDKTARYSAPIVTENGITLVKKGIMIIVR